MGSCVIKIRELELESENSILRLGGKEIKLPPKEFAILELLMRNPGKVFSPEALLNKVWSTESNTSPEAVSVCVRRLRKKVDIDPERPLISNIHGVGYRLESE